MAGDFESLRVVLHKSHGFLEFPGSVDGPWKRYVHDPDERGIYNGYIGSVDCVGGPCPSAGPGADGTAGMYLAQVPFEDNVRTDTSFTEGPGSNSLNAISVTPTVIAWPNVTEGPGSNSLAP